MRLRASGKLLLTAEYFVLDGATALAMPVRFGQTLEVKLDPNFPEKKLRWQSLEADGSRWFSAEFDLANVDLNHFTDEKTARTLQAILQNCRAKNPTFLAENQAVAVETQVDFPRAWGLGTSSTLIALLARWAGVDPFKILAETLGGSGYDLACAFAESAIFFRLENGQPQVQAVRFEPPFSENLYFVFLGKKQDSRAGVERHRERLPIFQKLAPRISQLSGQFLAAQTLPELDEIIREHERLTAEALDLPRAKSLYFNDFWGEVKSLGAWGGDFVLVTSPRPEAETRRFFNERGFEMFIPFSAMQQEI